MFELKGYVLIKNDAKCEFAMLKPSDWQGNICRVMEFNEKTQSILALHPSAAAMDMFDYSDIAAKFECSQVGEVLLPPNLKPIQQLTELHKRINRKGGYNTIVRRMVIAASLQKGKFYDGFLFIKQ